MQKALSTAKATKRIRLYGVCFAACRAFNHNRSLPQLWLCFGCFLGLSVYFGAAVGTLWLLCLNQTSCTSAKNEGQFE
jgi:hypothetical protein